MEREIATLSEVLKSRFDREEELEEKKKRLVEVEQELKAIEAGDLATGKDEEAEEREAARLNKKYGHISRRIYATKEEKEEAQAAADAAAGKAAQEAQGPAQGRGPAHESQPRPRGSPGPRRIFISSRQRQGKENGYFQKVEGKAIGVEGYEDFDFFVHYDKDAELWRVSEGKTGMGLGVQDEDQAEAVKEFREKLAEGGEDTTPENLTKIINEAILQQGLSPRYSPGKPGVSGEVSFKLEEGAERPALAPPFYSALRRTVEQKMGGAMPAKQFAALLKQPGIKQDEVKWTGILDWLAKKQGKVTKQEVLEFLDANGLQVKEVVKGGANQLPHRLTGFWSILEADMSIRIGMIRDRARRPN